jgi:NitT/TauT family transport system permease protein
MKLRTLIPQVLLLVVLLLGWEFVPQIPWLSSNSNFFNPFFVSSPSRIAARLVGLATGSGDSVLVWSYLWPTIYASAMGTAIGMAGGAALGVLLSNFAWLSAILRPFVVGINATPRVALVPVIVLLFGPTLTASVVIAVLVVFFIAFFNAYEGGTSVVPELVFNSQLLGGSRWQILRRVRLPYAVAWTIAGLPVTVTFAILSVVTAEVLTGYPGMGRLLLVATSTAEASLTFSVVVILAAVGLITVWFADEVRARILHWWAR